MSANASSSSPRNATSHPNPLFSNLNMYYFLLECMNYPSIIFSHTTFTIINILVFIPLCVFVLYLGVRRWRCSTVTMSHSDVFTYHTIVIELINVFGSTLICLGAHTDVPQMTIVGVYLHIMNSSGQTFFHILTCVERYLAVVHPVTYLSLKRAKWIRIRNIIIGWGWLLCFSVIGLMLIKNQQEINIMFHCIIAFSLTVVSFCSLSVLCVLIRPGPGDRGGGRQRVDQSKLRAFSTIMAILGVLVFRFGGNIITVTVYDSSHLEMSESCGLALSSAWYAIPSSLVLPLLFLQRAGKLLCCKNNNESGQGAG